MTDDHLPQPPYGLEPAEQCRHMGLNVGDTIEGREEYPGGWEEVRLTLLWLGEHVAVWRARLRRFHHPEWYEPEETANWTLDARRWRRIAQPPAPEDRGGSMTLSQLISHLEGLRSLLGDVPVVLRHLDDERDAGSYYSGSYYSMTPANFEAQLIYDGSRRLSVGVNGYYDPQEPHPTSRPLPEGAK